MAKLCCMAQSELRDRLNVTELTESRRSNLCLCQIRKTKNNCEQKFSIRTCLVSLGWVKENWFPIAESHLNWILSLQAVKTLVVIVNKIDLSVFHLKKVIWLHPSSGFVVTSSNRFYLQKICVKDFYERNLLWRSSTFVSIQFDI